MCFLDANKVIMDDNVTESRSRSSSGRILLKQRSFECEDNVDHDVVDTNSDNDVERKPETVDGGEADEENEDTSERTGKRLIKVVKIGRYLLVCLVFAK